MVSKVFSSLGESVMIVTLQGPGEARGHCDTAGPKATRDFMKPWGSMELMGHCDPGRLHGIMQTVVTVLGLTEMW